MSWIRSKPVSGSRSDIFTSRATRSVSARGSPAERASFARIRQHTVSHPNLSDVGEHEPLHDARVPLRSWAPGLPARARATRALLRGASRRVVRAALPSRSSGSPLLLIEAARYAPAFRGDERRWAARDRSP